MPRKRAREEVDLELDETITEETSKAPQDARLHRLRNMWQMASFMQYTYFFGKAVKIDEAIDMEASRAWKTTASVLVTDSLPQEFEEICMLAEKQHRLAEIGLALLKFVSSHRGLTPELFDEYTRRQYTAKSPTRNPFGDEEEPKKFSGFDVFTKIKVLHQLSVWTLGNPDRMRAMMTEKDNEQLQWRIEPFGWDDEDRTYYLLDDDRLYRCTDAPIPSTPVKAKPKAKSKVKSKPRAKPTRASKRRKLSSTLPEDSDDEYDELEVSAMELDGAANIAEPGIEEENDFGGMKWECIAVTMDEYQNFLESIRRTRDRNEKALHKAITESVIPILERRAEAHRAKAAQRQREFENLQRMATAKRSSRLAGKAERQREAEEAADLERKRAADLKMAHDEQRRQQQLEEARHSRMQTREQRLKEREVRRILHEEELARLEEMRARGEDHDSRHSERNLKNEMERRQKELEELKVEDEKWEFDCSGCGLHGENIDDGTHSIACERCNIWQHSKCNGIKEGDAERDDFHFVCADCKRKEEDARKPKIKPLKLGRVGLSSSPDAIRVAGDTLLGTLNGVHDQMIMPSDGAAQNNGQHHNLLHVPPLLPHGSATPSHTNGTTISAPQEPWTGNPLSPPGLDLHKRSQPGPPQDSHQVDQSHHHLHRQAHAKAVSSSGLHQQPTKINGHTHESESNPEQSSQDYRAPMPQSSYMNIFNAQPAAAASPVKQQKTPSPTAHRFIDRNSPFTAPTLPNGTASPKYNLSPPPTSAHKQRLAGQSPVKQPSPSPHMAARAYIPQYTSPSMPPPTYTPAAQAASVPVTTTPATQTPYHIAASPVTANFLRADAQVASSPIPPVGDGPVIPQKHDAGRAPSRDHATETAIFPPMTALSPSKLEDGKGMSVQAGAGGLGTGGIPVKKIPSSPVQPLAVLSSSPLASPRPVEAHLVDAPQD